MVNEISLVLTSIKSATDIIKGFTSLKTEVAVKEKAIELQNIILDLYSHINIMNVEFGKVIEEKESIEKVLNNINDWSVEKQKYILAEISPKVYAFVHKDYFESKEETYWLCAHCFESQRHKSIYQLKVDEGYQKKYYCPACKNEILFKNENYNLADAIITSGRKFGSWIDKY
ncbi:MAG: hypothetical protein WCZ90_19280 [Melioribacteraceae bacterium]